MSAQRSRKKQPTQADVAKLAGVSQATVSYVLNNNTVIAVPADTRQRIQDAIRELGYIPDRAARSLRTRKTYTLAGIIPDITNPFYPAFERGIQDLQFGSFAASLLALRRPLRAVGNFVQKLLPRRPSGIRRNNLIRGFAGFGRGVQRGLCNGTCRHYRVWQWYDMKA